MSQPDAEVPKPRAKRKYTASEASQRAARENGRKSKGRSTASKAVALNALKDGAYAKTLIIEGEDPAELESLVQTFIRDSRAGAPLEVEFATAAAHSWWLSKRVNRANTSALRRQVHDAEIGEQEARNRRVASISKDLNKNASDSVEKLRETTEGCLWLINQWTIISNMLDANKAILQSHHVRILRLLGKDPSALTTDVDCEDWSWHYLGSYPREGPCPLDIDLAHRLFDPYRAEEVTPEEFHERLGHWLDTLPSREQAFAFMRKRIDDAVNELFERYGMLEAEEGARRVMDVGAAGADDGLKAARRLRQHQVYRAETKTLLAAVKEMRLERLAEAAGDGGPGAAAEGPFGGPEWDAQKDPKCRPEIEAKPDVDQEVASVSEEGGNPNWEPGRVSELPVASCQCPEAPTPDPEAAPPRPQRIDVIDDPPYNYVEWPASLLAEFAKAAAAAGEGPGSTDAEGAETPPDAPEAAPLALGAPEMAPEGETATPAPPIAPEPSGGPVAPAAVPAPNPGHPIVWRPTPHPARPNEPRPWPRGQAPPHLRPPPHHNPSPGPGKGPGFDPRDG